MRRWWGYREEIEKMSKEMECKPKTVKKYTQRKGWEEEDKARETVQWGQ